MDSSKSRKAPVATAGLAEAEVDKILYCWYYGYAGHAKKDCPSKQRQTQSVGNCKAKPTTLKRPSPGDSFENHMCDTKTRSNMECNFHLNEPLLTLSHDVLLMLPS